LLTILIEPKRNVHSFSQRAALTTSR